MHTRWLAGRAFTAVSGLLVMAGVFAGTGPAAASAASCQAWTGAQPPSPGTLENFLSGVAVLSPCDVWAAGFDLSGGAYQTLIEHWNGFSWAQVDSPDPGSGQTERTRWIILPVTSGTVAKSRPPATFGHERFSSSAANPGSRPIWAAISRNSASLLPAMFAMIAVGSVRRYGR